MAPFYDLDLEDYDDDIAFIGDGAEKQQIGSGESGGNADQMAREVGHQRLRLRAGGREKAENYHHGGDGEAMYVASGHQCPAERPML